MSAGFRTAKYHFRLRMQAAGLWSEFVSRREELKGRGFDAAEVWRALMPVFETKLREQRE